MITQCKNCNNLAIIKVKDYYLCAECELKRIGYYDRTINDVSNTTRNKSRKIRDEIYFKR